MKKYAFLPIIVLFLFVCSCGSTSTDQIVDEIRNNDNLTKFTAETYCGNIVYYSDGDKVSQFYVEGGMGDGGFEINCFFKDEQLIFVDYYYFYDSPVTVDDETTWETIGYSYEYYFNNGKFDKCIDVDTEVTDFDALLIPQPQAFIDFANKIVNSKDDIDPEILCEGI